MEIIGLAIIVAFVVWFVWHVTGETDAGHYRYYARRTLKTGKSYRVLKWSNDDELVPWMRNGAVMDRKPHRNSRGFTYCVTFDDGKKYVGRKSFDCFGDWRDYVGSGVLVTERIEARPKAGQVVAREVLGVYSDDARLASAEEALQRKWNVVADPGYLNLMVGQR